MTTGGLDDEAVPCGDVGLTHGCCGVDSCGGRGGPAPAVDNTSRSPQGVSTNMVLV